VASSDWLRGATRWVFAMFSSIRRLGFLEYCDPSFNAGVGGSDCSMVNKTAFGQLMGGGGGIGSRERGHVWIPSPLAVA
jgi:hypothetical protein